MTRNGIVLSFTVTLCALAGGSAAIADHHEAADSTMATDFSDCQGPVSTWRENELIEGGRLAGFLEAARDHQVWLASKGHDGVRVRAWTAFEQAPEEEARPRLVAFGSEVTYPSYAALDTVMSTREDDRDDAYDAFVQKYRENTKIAAVRFVCFGE